MRNVTRSRGKLTIGAIAIALLVLPSLAQAGARKVKTPTRTNTPAPTRTPTIALPTSTRTNTPLPTSTRTNTPLPTSTRINTPLPANTPTNTLAPTNTPAPCQPINLGSALTVSVSGATAGASSQSGSCGGAGAPEATYIYTAPMAGFYVIDTVGSAFNTLLYVRYGSCLGVELACNDDFNATPQSQVSLNLSAGQTIYIAVDGSGSASGSFNLHIEDPAPPTSTPAHTPVPPTATPTNTTVPPTSTAVPPTSTATNTRVPPTATPTNTAVPPTSTAVRPTSTPANTVAPTSTRTNTPLPTNTPVPPTSTRTYTPWLTSTPTPTPTATWTPAGSGGGAHVWSQRSGSIGEDYGQAVAVDKSADCDGRGGTNCILLTGFFAAGLDDTGGALSCSGQTVFLAKYSAMGTHLWSQCTQGLSGGAYGYAVAVDRNGDVIVTGNFAATRDFGGGPLTSAGGSDIFVAKYSRTGDHLWSERFGSSTMDGFDRESGLGIAVDATGNLVVTGRFNGTIDFGGGPLISAGDPDIFLLKLSGAGDHLWSKCFGGAANAEAGNAVAVDDANDIVVTGSFNGTVDFGRGPLTSSNLDIFLAKYDQNGTCLWSRRFGGPSSTDSGRGIVVDGNGNIVITGNFIGSVDFGGGALTSAGGDDIFVAKYSAAGAHVWSKRFGDPFAFVGGDIGKHVAIDTRANCDGRNGANCVLLTGYFLGTADFGGGPLSGAGSTDVFVAKYSANGTHLWSKRFGGAMIDESMAAAVDGAGNAAVTGRFGTTIDFGGGPLTTLGGSDTYLVKLAP